MKESKKNDLKDRRCGMVAVFTVVGCAFYNAFC